MRNLETQDCGYLKPHIIYYQGNWYCVSKGPWVCGINATIKGAYEDWMYCSGKAQLWGGRIV